MGNVLTVLFLIGLISLVIGLIKPSLVIKWGKARNRKLVLKYYGTSLIILFIAIGVITPKNNLKDKEENTILIEQQSENKEEIEKPAENINISGDNRFIIKSNPNTTNAIDEFYYRTKENSNEFTEDDIKEAIRFINSNYNDYWNDNDKMHKALYYGYLLQNVKADKAKANKNSIDYTIYQLGLDTVQAVKYIYRNIEKIEDPSTQNNLNQIKKSLNLIPKDYKI